MQNVLKESRKRRAVEFPVLKYLFGFGIFLLSAGIFGYLSLNLAIKRGEKVTVPNVVNKSVAEALDMLSERNLELRKTGARNSFMIPENYVLSQDPIAGSVVKEGTPVSVVISMGSKISLVPNLVGRSLREARVDLNRVGLREGRLSRMHHREKIDTVLSQAPPPDREVERETPVSMLLSLGPRPREYRLPNLVGLPLERASAYLESLGITVGNITTKVDPTQPQGVILDQDPRPGSLIAEDSSVSLVMTTLTGEETGAERKFAALLFNVPYAFWPKAVKIEVTDPDGSRTIYEEVDEPGSHIKIAFGYSAQCTVKVYLDGVLEMERTFR